MKIPFVDLKSQYLSIKDEMDACIAEVINHSAFIGGSQVNIFERKFGELYGVDHVISCANGTDSLYIIMRMLGIGTGDEVITVANSWISSSETISQTGARPVFVDIDPVYYSMDVDLFKKAITSRTKAVIAVHLQGQVCEIEKISEICKEKGIYLIEDCAQSHFSSYKNTLAGLRGIAGSFSFYPGKNLGAYGDAGCIITNDKQLADQCRMFARHGALVKHQHQIEGVNSRLDGIQAAVLNAKLPYILDWTEKRIANAALYTQHLSGIKDIVLPVARPDSRHTWHLYVIRARNRDELARHLEKDGIETAIHYPIALPNLPAYAYLGHSAEDFPVASKFQKEILSLPMYPELTEQMIIHIANSIQSFYSGV